jgi:hypothetical protein
MLIASKMTTSVVCQVSSIDNVGQQKGIIFTFAPPEKIAPTNFLRRVRLYAASVHRHFESCTQSFSNQ